MNRFRHPATFSRCVLLALGLSALKGSCSQAPTAERVQGSSLEEVVRLYQTDLQGVSRFYDLPWSEVRFDRLEQLQSDWRKRLAAVRFEDLDQQGRIDYLLLRNKIESELDHLALDRRWLRELDELLAFRSPIQQLERSRWLMQPLDPQSAASTVAALPDQLKKLRERLGKGKKAEKDAKEGSKDSQPPAAKPEAGSEPTAPAFTNGSSSPTASSEAKPDEPAPLKIPPWLAKRAATAAEELRDTLKTWYSFYEGYQPDFSWWLKRPYEEAGKAIEEYSKFLREEIAGLKGKDEDPLLGEPIGAQALAQDLATEMIPYTPEQLIAIAERELAWCETEMKNAARQMGLGEDWKAALAKVKADFVPPGKQDEFVSACARQAIQYVKDHDLVSVPPLCEETWRLSMISPETQKTLPFAAYGGQNMMVAYAKEDMKQEDKLMAMRGNNRHFTRIVVAHELIPGHHLQAFCAARNRPYRGLFSTAFLVEGWALYWELLLWEHGYAQTPEDRIGMLFWRMHRCARIIVSLRFHLGQVKPQEMVDFLVDRVGHEKLGATGEVRRFIGNGYSPLYQCGYMIGGLQLRALHRQLVGPGKMTNRQFNDAILSFGPIPIELIRAGLLKLPLTRESQADWRFADP